METRSCAYRMSCRLASVTSVDRRAGDGEEIDDPVISPDGETLNFEAGVLSGGGKRKPDLCRRNWRRNAQRRGG